MDDVNTLRHAGPDSWLADEIFRMARTEGFSRVGLLTSEEAYAHGVLRRQLALRGLSCLVPTVAERRELLYAWDLLDSDPASATFHLLAVVRMLREREGTQRVLVACPRYEERLSAQPGETDLIFAVAHLQKVVRSHWHVRRGEDLPIKWLGW